MSKLSCRGLFFCILTICMIPLQAWATLPQTLRVVTEATYPPFEFISAEGSIQGFDIDIVNALCKHIKVSCMFSNQPWDSLIPSLQLGKFDVLVGGINITETRKKQVDFTEPYYMNTDSFVAPKNKALDVSRAGLQGKTVGVQRSTTAQYFLQGEYPQTKIKTYLSQQDAFLDLVLGRVDAVLGDTPVVMKWLKESHSSPKYVVVGQPMNSAQYFGMGYGIALKKGNAELLAAFSKALAEIKANGEYEKIVKKYF